MEHSDPAAIINDILTAPSWQRERTTGELINFIARREEAIDEQVFEF